VSTIKPTCEQLRHSTVLSYPKAKELEVFQSEVKLSD